MKQIKKATKKIRVIKPLIAYAVIDKKNGKINTNDIFKDEDIKCDKTEEVIKVLILPVGKDIRVKTVNSPGASFINIHYKN